MRESKRESKALKLTEGIISTIREPLVVLDANLKVISTNRSFNQTFRVSQADSEGRLMYELGNRQWDIPRLRELLEAILPQKVAFENFEVDHEFPAIGRRVMLLNARKIYEQSEDMELILLAIEDITDRKRGEQELTKSRERLQLLTSQLLLAQERERKRIAVDLHDGLLSELAATKYLLEEKVMRVDQGKPITSGELRRIKDILIGTIKEARRIMNNLHPSVLDELGLLAAMNCLCEEYKKSYPHISVQTAIAVSESDISDGIRIAIFRVLQEAMNNFAKHGKGDRVEVSLSRSDGAFSFVIRDNGQGFEVEKVERGFGLTSMKERVELLGGKFQIESIISQGTTIRATWSI